METNFFKQLTGMNLTGSLRMNIQLLDANNITVSVLALSDSANSKTEKKIPPLVLSGTVEELDNQFFSSITTPLQKTAGLLRNLKQHEEAVKTAVKDAASKPASTTPKSDKRRKFEEQLKRVTDLEKQNKIGQAIGQMPDAKSYPEYAKEINARMQELRGKHQSLSLFGDEPVTATNTEEPELPGTEEANEEPDPDEEDPDPDEDNNDNEDEFDPNR